MIFDLYSSLMNNSFPINFETFFNFNYFKSSNANSDRLLQCFLKKPAETQKRAEFLNGLNDQF